MAFDPEPIAERVSELLAEAGDPKKAADMAAYMKTEMPFYGVQAAERDGIVREVKPDIDLESRDDYEALVLAHWERPHREEKYIAVRLARRWSRYIGPASMPLYERMIREGAWWDFVDEIAEHLVGRVLERAPEQTWPILDAWIEDEDMWIRRAAVLAQKRRKDDTEPNKLFDYCLKLAHEDEFFIRKAVGWALREYSYVDPEAVRTFLVEHHDELSGLTIREASKKLEGFEGPSS